jgi:uncharacterized membrane protein
MTRYASFYGGRELRFAVVRALREDGFDVLAISETMQRSDDRELIVRKSVAGNVPGCLL